MKLGENILQETQLLCIILLCFLCFLIIVGILQTIVRFKCGLEIGIITLPLSPQTSAAGVMAITLQLIMSAKLAATWEEDLSISPH